MPIYYAIDQPVSCIAGHARGHHLGLLPVKQRVSNSNKRNDLAAPREAFEGLGLEQQDQRPNTLDFGPEASWGKRAI